LLILVQENPGKESGEKLNIAVQSAFYCEPTQDNYHFTSLSWVVPRNQQTWSQMYAITEEFVDTFNRQYNNPIRDFFLIQNSLDQVFTRLATHESTADMEAVFGTSQQVCLQKSCEFGFIVII
jgi:hypothetical protein